MISSDLNIHLSEKNEQSDFERAHWELSKSINHP